MTAWHDSLSRNMRDMRDKLLDSLTDAPKVANSTRWTTPDSANPSLENKVGEYRYLILVVR